MEDDPFSTNAIRTAYDVAAQDYADAFGDDLARLPLDRAMLDEAAALAGPRAAVLDLGCGPGTVASYLRLSGMHPLGLDLSGAMLAVARGRDGAVPGVQADMRALPLRSESFALVVAYYALQHLARAELGAALSEARRVLIPDGLLLVAAHLGDHDVTSDEFLGHRVESFGGALYRAEDLGAALEATGFDTLMERRRGPLPHEFESERLYVLARRTG